MNKMNDMNSNNMTTTANKEGLDTETLKKGTDIVLEAKQLGLNVWRGNMVCCPFHADNRPSMRLYNQAGEVPHYYCFGCGANGDVIALAMQMKRVGFREAKEWLRKNHAKMDRGAAGEAAASTASHGSLHAGRGAGKQPVSTVYLEKVMECSPLTPEARRFLFEERHLSPEVVERCRIGALSHAMPCSPDGRQGSYPAHSLLIPYYDTQGRLITVQSRYLGTREGEPRFRFPAHTDSAHLYGQQWVAGLQPGSKVALAEGISDCWTLLTLGFPAVAMPSSTTLDTGSLPLLADKEVHVWPDNDAAGRKFYFSMKKLLPGLVYHQLPTDVNDLSDCYVRLRREGKSVEEAKSEFVKM